MIDKIKAFIQRGNELGIPMPVFRDPQTGKGSVTLTLVVLSSICVIASLLTKKVDAGSSTEFLLISLGAYLGRKFQTKSGTSVDTK
jgi:hypothetical protein